MSLIIDALKKAQQLRLNGADGSPMLKNPYPNKKRKASFKKQWILIGAGLISLGILLFVFLKPPSLPSATRTNPAMVSVEIKPPISASEETSSETSKEIANLPRDEESLPAQSSAEDYGTRADQALNRNGTGQALNRNDTGQAPNRPGSGQALNPAGGGTGAQRSSNVAAALSDRPSRPQAEKKTPKSKMSPSPPLPPATQKEEAPPKSIGVEQVGGKDHTLASDVLYHFNSGVTFYNQKNFSKAIQAYQKVIELDPTYVEAYNNLGIIYQMIGDVDRASAAYQKSTEINPKYEKGYNNLGILLLLRGRYEEASEAFQKALAINANNIESHIYLGILFKKKGQWQEAIESYQRALAIDPLHGETHYNIALLYEQLEKFELAVGHYQQFIQLSSKSHPELVSRVQRHLNDIMKAKNK
jgi:tetratricopeptide (TPR) repeat protein